MTPGEHTDPCPRCGRTDTYGRFRQWCSGNGCGYDGPPPTIFSRLVCKILGHNPTSTDNGFPYCERCHMFDPDNGATDNTCDHFWVYFGHLHGSMTPYHNHRRCRDCGAVQAGSLYDGRFKRRPWSDDTMKDRSDRRFENESYGPNNSRLTDPDPRRTPDDVSVTYDEI